jgi:hypothetical protein
MRHHLGSLYKAAYSLLNSCSGNIRLLESAEIAFRRQDQWRRFTTGGPCPSLSALFGTGQLPHILNHSIRVCRCVETHHFIPSSILAPASRPSFFDDAGPPAFSFSCRASAPDHPCTTQRLSQKLPRSTRCSKSPPPQPKEP